MIRPDCLQPERAAWLAGIPVCATFLFYAMPDDVRQSLWFIFLPQALAYLSLAVWASLNRCLKIRLRLDPPRFASGLRWGTLLGAALGVINLTVILFVVTQVGGDIEFLRNTPHAMLPFWIMMPLGIAIIAGLVELNFRGFQLGRLATLFKNVPYGQIYAVALSAMAFALDPFMVHVFHHLHWIALWDGLVWGLLLLRTGSLYATMVAHAVEVWILYIGLKFWFT